MERVVVYVDEATRAALLGLVAQERRSMSAVAAALITEALGGLGIRPGAEGADGGREASPSPEPPGPVGRVFDRRER